MVSTAACVIEKGLLQAEGIYGLSVARYQPFVRHPYFFQKKETPSMQNSNPYKIQQPARRRQWLIGLVPMLLVMVVLLFTCCKPFQSLEYRGLSNWDLKPRSLTESELSADVQLFNPNKHKVTVKRIEAEIMVNDQPWGTYFSDSLTTLSPQTLHAFPLKLKVKNSYLLTGGLSIAAGGSLPYRLKGKIKGTYRGITADVPFTYEGSFSDKDLKF